MTIDNDIMRMTQEEMVDEIMTLRGQRNALIVALEALVEQCGEVSPFAGNDVSVRSVRQAGKFMNAVKQSRTALALAKGDK